MKVWRKLVWASNRAFINLRISELASLDIPKGKDTRFKTLINPKDRTILIILRPPNEMETAEKKEEEKFKLAEIVDVL